jgi:poly(3-hydroxybutyrate) depolymerase
MKSLLALALLINNAPVVSGQGAASDITRQASGSFVFTDQHSITVWFCRPPSLGNDSRIVFVMHGSESQTARQACDIASPALAPLNAIVLAPQFSEQYYPGDAYMFGNMLDAAGRIRPTREWALTTIDRLFEVVRRDLNLTRTEYDIVGFSGGARFVHRLVLFVPDARFRRAVAASADREREGAAMAQGTNRFARGLRFFATATEQANSLGVPLRWQLQIVHDVEHAPVPMVRAALQLLR